MIEAEHGELSIACQCALLGLPRSTYYYAPKRESPSNLAMMRLIDEQYLRTPYYGAPEMTEHLRRLGHTVNHKRTERLMRLMNLRATTPRRWVSQPDPTHRIYPYLLRDLVIERPNEVWCSDITYIRLAGGFIYLVAVMDWFSRYVIAWELSNTLYVDFCLTALYRALRRGRPEIFNTDQGSQFTSLAFTRCLLDHNIRVSMDGLAFLRKDCSRCSIPTNPVSVLETPSRYGEEVRIHGQYSIVTEWAGNPFKLSRASHAGRAALGALHYGSIRVNIELFSAIKADVWHVITDA